MAQRALEDVHAPGHTLSICYALSEALCPTVLLRNDDTGIDQVDLILPALYEPLEFSIAIPLCTNDAVARNRRFQDLSAQQEAMTVSRC